MAIRIYARVSTLDQSFDQQMQDIKTYFAAHNIDMNDVADIVKEHVSGGQSYEDREFNKLLNKCQAGDYIYAASTDRIGRNFVNMMKLMEDAKNRGVIIVACKQGLSLDDDNPMAKIVLAVTAIMDEDERRRIRHRIANKKAWQREQIAQQGYFVVERGPNAGELCTYVGSPKGHDTSAATEASAMARQNALMEWRKQSKAYKWVIRQYLKGKTRQQIITEFNELHADNPDIYCTRTGKPLTKAVLCKWLQSVNIVAVA